MPHPHRDSLQGGTHLRCDLTPMWSLESLLLSRTDRQKIRLHMFTFYLCSVSRVKSVFEHHLFFKFLQKKGSFDLFPFCFLFFPFYCKILQVHCNIFLLLVVDITYLFIFFFFGRMLASSLVPLWMWTKLFGPVTSLHCEMLKWSEPALLAVFALWSEVAVSWRKMRQMAG